MYGIGFTFPDRVWSKVTNSNLQRSEKILIIFILNIKIDQLKFYIYTVLV